MDEVLKLLVAGGVGAVTIAAVLYAAAENRLRGTFATRAEVNGVGGRIEGWSSMFARFDDRVDEHERRLKELELTSRHEWKRISEQMEATAKTLERVTAKLTEVSDEHIRLVTAWDMQGKRPLRREGEDPSTR